MLIIDCISDLHGFQPDLEGGDLLIVAGDLVASDKDSQYLTFFRWLAMQSYKKVVWIAGNHDGLIAKNGDPITGGGTIEYLQDSGTEFEGLKIWGSPWTPEFCNWDFMLPPEKLKEKWSLIPYDTDILITHGPPWGILDECPDMDCMMNHAGCKHLRERLEHIKPKLHVFGHIHEGHGQLIFKRPGHGTENNTLCVNASIMNGHYYPVNKPTRIILS